MKLPKTVFICALIASVTFAAVSGLPLQADAKHEYKMQDGDLPNFHEVHPYLFRGGEPSKNGLKQLKEMGVKTVIDLRGHPGRVKTEAAWCKELDMSHINLPMSSAAPTTEQVSAFLDKVDKARQNPEAGPVFVHCAHGSDRAGCMVGIWRVSRDNWPYDRAFKEMRKYWFNPKFKNLSATVARYAAGR